MQTWQSLKKGPLRTCRKPSEGTSRAKEPLRRYRTSKVSVGGAISNGARCFRPARAWFVRRGRCCRRGRGRRDVESKPYVGFVNKKTDGRVRHRPRPGYLMGKFPWLNPSKDPGARRSARAVAVLPPCVRYKPLLSKSSSGDSSRWESPHVDISHWASVRRNTASRGTINSR